MKVAYGNPANIMAHGEQILTKPYEELRSGVREPLNKSLPLRRGKVSMGVPALIS